MQEGKNGLTTSSKRWWLAAFCAIAVVVGTYALVRVQQDDVALFGSVSEKVRARMLSLLPDPDETTGCRDEAGRGHRIKCSRTPHGTCTLLVAPGTEILFELNRAIPPYDAFYNEFCSELGNQPSKLRWVPLPPQPVVVGEGGVGGWIGDGVVWATEKYILYVASDQPGNHGTLTLREPAGIRGTHGFQLTVVSSGKGVHGTRLTDVPKDSWWGLGSGLRLRVVRTRSAKELGENRLLPPGAFEMRGHNLSDGREYPLYRFPGRPLSKSPDLSQMTEDRLQEWQRWQAEAQAMVRQYLRDANVGK